MRYVLAAMLFMLLPRFVAHGLNGAGHGSVYIFGFLILAALIHGSVIVSRGRENTSPLGVAADLLHQSSLFLTMLAMGTLALGVAGFTFNEVFWRTFPNLGFSFVLLACAGALCLLGRDHFLMVVSGLTGLALTGMFGVALKAIPTPMSFVEASSSPNLFAMALAVAPVLLGADLVYGVGDGEKRTLKPALWATGAGAVVLSILAWAGMLLLDGPRLATLSVPQMALAREALGNNGRMLMGGAGILCTLGGVAVMLRSAMRMDTVKNGRREIRIVLGCVMLGAMLGTGFSGEEITETLLTLALGGWFLANAMTCGSCLKGPDRHWPIIGLAGSLLLGLAWVWGSWDHVIYAPHYLQEFFSAHG